MDDLTDEVIRLRHIQETHTKMINKNIEIIAFMAICYKDIKKRVEALENNNSFIKGCIDGLMTRIEKLESEVEELEKEKSIGQKNE